MDKPALLLALLALTSIVASENPLLNAQNPGSSSVNVIFIMDTSGSMAGEKLALTKNAANAAVGMLKGKNMGISLFSYDNCRVAIDSGFTEDMDAIQAEISNFTAHSSTPIAHSLEQAYSYIDENSTAGRAVVILFSDGEETCGGDPCEVVKKRQNATGIPIYTIGYMVGAEADSQLACIANASGGIYFRAPTIDTINETLGKAFQTVVASCASDSDCNESQACNEGICVQPKLRLVFVPVNWGGGEFADEADHQYNLFVSSVPLSDCKGLVSKIIIDKPLAIEDITKLGGHEVLQRIEKYAKEEYAHSYDFVIGVGGELSFPENVAGYTTRGQNVVFVRRGYDIVTAHELGHKFGLKDEYCSCPGTGLCDEEPNPLEKDLGCDVNGSCCWNDSTCSLGGYETLGCHKCCDGNRNVLGGISIMSWANAREPRAHDDVSLRYLAQDPRLRCDK